MKETRVLDRELVFATLLRRLNTVSGLEDADIAALHELPIAIRHWEAGRAIVSDGERPTDSCLVIEGFCVRSKLIASGQRQILSIHIPGEIPDLQSLHLHRMDHDLISLTACTLGFISHASLRALTRAKPNLAEMLWRDTLIDAAMFREWIVNVGQRPATGRLAHIVLELRKRLEVTGRPAGDNFEMPLTQEQIGEALGITPVHANRVIKQLREERIVDISRGRVTVLDEAKLGELAQFDDRYLHQNPSL
ncbi:Crp/Fnr family transcriptional regulator [Bradyrhizobium jicamae]|uniref:Crp/Fnr family transcriptional regulator n=1 Tax=Bradyrhizobium jicamae TaxID=280332 RepID=A0A0R3M344_9BRAD|nr:Crp/Fnr family transcriptional regulator [Bradyrhizobium jicamae]KRR14676.1 Crp/Fnr family transcriptional regulator [Bradyrhizobium jicamae]